MSSAAGKRPADPDGDPPDPNKRVRPNYPASYRLHAAAYAGDEAAVRRFVAAGDDVIEVKWDDDYYLDLTPLGYAALAGNLALVRYFADETTALMCSAYENEAALAAAARGGHLGIVRYLVEDACIDVPADSAIPVSAAAKYGDLEVMRYLIESVGFSVNSCEDNMCALLIAVNANHVDVVSYMIEAGADTSARECYTGQTATCFATTPEMVQCLVEYGLPFGKRRNCGDCGDLNALDCALIFANEDLARTLVKVDVPYPERAKSKYAPLRMWARGEHPIQLERPAVEKALLGLRGRCQFPAAVVHFIGEFVSLV